MIQKTLRHAALLGTALLLAGCNAGDDLVARGEALSQEKGCIACHGADGVSIAPSFPNLAGQWPQYLRVQLVKYKTGERQNAVMNGQAANLTREEIAALAAFYAAQ
ncbi:MAG: c-type cytochrome [Pseudomonadales bacterium]